MRWKWAAKHSVDLKHPPRPLVRNIMTSANAELIMHQVAGADPISLVYQGGGSSARALEC